MAYAPGPVPRDPYRPGGPLGFLPEYYATGSKPPLGFIPAVAAAVPSIVAPVESAISSVIHSITGVFGAPAATTEKPIALQLQTWAMAGNLTALSAMINRGTIQTQGYKALYDPLIATVKTAHESWYEQALAMTEPGKQPGGKAFWSYPQSQVLSAVASNTVYASDSPGKNPGSGGSGVTAAGFSSPLMIAALLGAVIMGPKLLKGR